MPLILINVMQSYYFAIQTVTKLLNNTIQIKSIFINILREVN